MGDLQTELKQKLEEVQRAVHEHHKMNEERLKQMEEKGTVVADLQEKMAKANEHIDSVLDQVKNIQAAMKRAPLTGGSPTDEALAKKAQQLSQLAGREVSTDEADGYFKSMNAYLRKGEERPELKMMSVDNDPQGGYWVDPDTTGRVVEFLYETSPIRQVAAQQTIGTDALEGTYDLQETDGEWEGERTSSVESNHPGIGKWRIPVHELRFRHYATQKLLDDSAVNVENWLAGKTQRKAARKMNAAFVLGDGNGKPRGFLTYPAGTPTSANFQRIKQTKTGVNGGFAASDPGDILVRVAYDLKPEYRAGAVWAMNRATNAEVRLLKDGNGNYMWQPNFTQLGAQSLLGAPILNFEDMPNISDNGLAIAFGNFGEAYQIVDRAGISVLRDPYTNYPLVKFNTRLRTGGDVVNFDALHLIKFAA